MTRGGVAKVKATSRRRGRRLAQPDITDEVWLPAEDWAAIKVGASVEVTLPSGHSYTGRVDSKTPDSDLVWIISSAGQGRQMYGNRDGVRLLPV
ncbi:MULTISPECIES: efflux RND transporter periplasmic adaptor subunit [unclassified Arthrobacter]|uniref:efflux RND transporter periplasmic adaptor subunit n=1 Tax=unclassified Arthrobacter TaxID=235627 RepID=UPI001F304DFD|nr:efflux RND transporter periplasmic adaptor subunit [Arthrobacter sp. FW305-BF8]UKA53884.1 efflux RND transporter periplasmic adaptor subunit [Arthrobacter sp. FW305-BF8]